mmetsp:Transcript_81434/g.174336  ORF Transcript_81434/g.174336 Transcript_81434/m.174336 type:complete len:358 (-) Transcript_81434:63-1136(-)
MELGSHATVGCAAAVSASAWSQEPSPGRGNGRNLVTGKMATAEATSSGTIFKDDACRRFEEWEEWDTTIPLWKHAFAGSCAGVMEHIGMYPLDTVKTHMQALRPDGSRVTLSGVVRGIVQQSGGLGFMRGCSAIASGCIPAHMALFTSYECSKKRLLSGSEHTPLRAALCGAAATACHDAILTPMDLVKQRMQLGCYRNVGECLRLVLRLEGMRGLYRSMPTTMAMNIPFGSVLVATNESLKVSFGIVHMKREDARASLPWHFLSAGLGGALASGATQPLDVIKTRLQTQDCLVHSTTVGSLGSPKYMGFLPAVTTIMREEGGPALFHGLLPRMLHAIPAAAMCWGTYETVKSILSN